MKHRPIVVVAVVFAVVGGLSLLAQRSTSPEAVVDVLARDPQHLQETLRECRLQIVPAQIPACAAATAAWRRRFLACGVAEATCDSKASERVNAAATADQSSPVETSPERFGP